MLSFLASLLNLLWLSSVEVHFWTIFWVISVLIFMKLYHKRKRWIDFMGCDLNYLWIGGQKENGEKQTFLLLQGSTSREVSCYALGSLLHVIVWDWISEWSIINCQFDNFFFFNFDLMVTWIGSGNTLLWALCTFFPV